MTEQDNTNQTGVQVVIETMQWEEVASFEATDHQSFVQMAADHGVEMPVSCCSWACFVCACKVKEGLKSVDIAKLSVPLVDIDEDQVLACVGGVKPEAFSDGRFHRIVLQRLM